MGPYPDWIGEIPPVNQKTTIKILSTCSERRVCKPCRKREAENKADPVYGGVQHVSFFKLLGRNRPCQEPFSEGSRFPA